MSNYNIEFDENDKVVICIDDCDKLFTCLSAAELLPLLEELKRKGQVFKEFDLQKVCVEIYLDDGMYYWIHTYDDNETYDDMDASLSQEGINKIHEFVSNL